MSLSKRIAERTSGFRANIEVAEWGEDNTPLIVYYGPMLAGEMDRIQRKHPNFLNDISFAGMVDIIILKAEDREGNKLFTLEDKPILMREEMNVISKVASAIVTVKTVGDHEKN